MAAALVFLQHTLSGCQLDDWIDVAGFRIGRIGTALFFLLAGLLAASSNRAPLNWFRNRLSTLFPTFWVVTIIGFCFAAVTGYKDFDTWQVFCQMTAVGYFTHDEHMVNVATWFMSPLLLLYLAATVSRMTRPRLLPCVLAAMFAGAALSAASEPPVVACHTVTFLFAWLVGRCSADRQQQSAALASVVLSLLCLFQPEFRYGAVAMTALTFALPVQARIPLTRGFGRIAYEWFLVHGLCINAVAFTSDNPLLMIPVAAGASVVGASALKRLVQWLRQAVSSVVLPRQRQLVVRSETKVAPIESIDLEADSSVQEPALYEASVISQ